MKLTVEGLNTLDRLVSEDVNEEGGSCVGVLIDSMEQLLLRPEHIKDIDELFKTIDNSALFRDNITVSKNAVALLNTCRENDEPFFNSIDCGNFSIDGCVVRASFSGWMLQPSTNGVAGIIHLIGVMNALKASGQLPQNAKVCRDS